MSAHANQSSMIHSFWKMLLSVYFIKTTNIKNVILENIVFNFFLLTNYVFSFFKSLKIDVLIIKLYFF